MRALRRDPLRLFPRIARRKASDRSPLRESSTGSPLARGRAGVLVAALTAISLNTSPAAADLEICNRTSFVVETAIGIEDQGAAATRGWFRVDPGACRSVMRGDPVFDRIYVHARTLPIYGTIEPLVPAQTALCVGEGEFLIAGARRCTGDKQRLVSFGAMQPSESENGKAVHIAEPAGYAPEQAGLAAVQRLLTLAGINAEPIDGVAGPRTEAAIKQFLDERNLPAGAGETADLLDLLIAAVRDGAGPGLLWCNETAYPVMAALGIAEGSNVTTRGWWRVEAGSCVRPELPRRHGGHIFSFAEAVDENGAVALHNGQPLAWGGGKQLCVRNSRFEIDEHGDCAARALTARGFATVALPQGAGATVRFQEP